VSVVFSEDVRPAQKLEVSISTVTLFYEIKLIEAQGKNGLLNFQQMQVSYAISSRDRCLAQEHDWRYKL